MKKVSQSISHNQAHELILQYENGLKNKGINPADVTSDVIKKKMLQKVVEHMFSEEKTKSKPATGIINSLFEEINSFNITIPKSFSLNTFIEEHEKNFHYGISNPIKEKNWSPSQPLERGKTYTVKVIQLKKTVSSQACVDLIKEHRGILPNGEGLGIIWQEAADKLPMGLTIGFDKKDVLPIHDSGDHIVPYLRCRSLGWLFYSPTSWATDWFDGGHFVFLCDLPAGKAGK